MDAHGMMQAGWTETTRRVNGLTFHVVEAGPIDGPLLILLHGFPEFWWAWRHQISPLALEGYHVIVPDMRGYNLSEAPQDVSAYNIDILASDVIALADAYDSDRFYLVGHDWGGVVAWWVAVKYPERLLRLVIMDAPHPDILGAQAMKHPTQALRSTYVAFFQVPWLPEATLGAFDFKLLKRTMERSARSNTFEVGALDRYADAWRHPGSLTAMLNYYRALGERNVREAPARISPPTLILWGEKDSFLEHHIAQASLDLCDDSRLIIIESATHWIHLEEPVRTTEEIINFSAAF